MLFTLVLTAVAEAPFSFESTPGKLPKTIVPRNYSLRIQPDLTHFTSRGTATIDLEVLKPTAEIVLNALGLEIKNAVIGVKSSDTNDDLPLTINPDSAKQTVTFKPGSTLKPGKYRLALEFTGHIGEQAQGLFYVKYSVPSGKKIMLGTQMEPTDARRMFPCWDEPVFRATFDLTVVLPENFKAISNMPIQRETKLDSGLNEIRFARTPAMPSYLVVLVAGELEELQDSVEGTQIRVITTEGKKEQARYALEATKKLLPYYNRYFGIKYPLPKLDQIAIPGGFDGAMENWGGITYNESSLLFDPRASSQQTKRDIFVTVAHEMAHQWFGDLVTAAWWDNLWLNEGFATWMENKATDHFNPEWQMRLSASSDKTAVMSGDARGTTHPIQQPVDNESDADDAFDTITYQKGEAFLRMLEDYLGPEDFRGGIHRYLSRHRYSNTTTADLWDALESESGKPVASIASGWTEQPGLPVVKVKAECINGKQMVTLEQERFTVLDPNAEPLEWKIPVALVNIARDRVPKYVLLEEKTASVEFDECKGIIKANAGDVGYYRVSYDPALYERIKNHLTAFSNIDCLNLLDDSWAMVEAERSSPTNYFALAERLRENPTLAVWEQILSTLYLIDELEINSPRRAAFQEYCRILLRPQMQRLGWRVKPGEPVTDPLLRSRLISGLGHFGDQQIIKEAHSRFEEFVAQPGSLAPDLRPSVLSIVGRYSDRKTYDRIHTLARNAKGTEERQMYYQALAAALDRALAKSTLAIALTEETVPQEATGLVVQVAGGSEHPELAWEFTREHMKQLLPRVDAFDRNNYIPSILGSFSDAERASELEAYAKTNKSDTSLIKAHEAAEEIRFKAALKKRNLPVIDQWVATRISGKALEPLIK